MTSATTAVVLVTAGYGIALWVGWWLSERNDNDNDN